MATLIAVATLAARPIPSAVVTATVSNSNMKKGSIAHGTFILSGANIFNDKEDVLTAISTANYNAALCELTLVGLT
jgi:hypothetical protein